MKRLNFVLHDFFRCAWTSDHARDIWEPRIHRIATSISELQWLTVNSGLRSGALVRLTPEQLIQHAKQWIEFDIHFLPLGLESLGTSVYQSQTSSYVPGEPFLVCVAIGSRQTVLEMASAYKNHDDEIIGNLLGYPKCCRSFFKRVWIKQEHIDTTWPMSKATSGSVITNDNFAHLLRIEKPANTNILLRGLGVRAVFHLPCRLDCMKSVEFADHVLELGSERFPKEMEWLRQILSWPMEWSALHGIAEVKTPVVKCIMTTDATPSLYRVNIAGTRIPDEAPKGLGEVYRQPKRLPIVKLKSFQRGLGKSV